MKKIVSILAGCIIAMNAMAVPARQGAIMRTAPDGTQKIVYLHGNEDFHYMTDVSGQWLDEKTLTPLSKEAIALRTQEGVNRQQRRARQQLEAVGDEPNPAPRGLVILVNFKDTKFVTSKDTMDAMLNSDHFGRAYKYVHTYVDENTDKTVTVRYDGSSEGSARKYFYDQSYGQYNPQFDVIGPVTVEQDASYYGSNNDAYTYVMIKEACELADPNVNFANYDNDNDGKVDFVYVIYAGFGEADGGPEETIWPHQSDVSNRGYYHDGKKIGRYACGSELSFYSKIYAGIGTFCHEFSHVLGLPDLYYTSSSTSGTVPHTLYQWSILDYGPYNNDGNTPPAYTAYERFYMKWLTPRMLTTPEYITLHPINEGNGESLLISTANTHNMVGWNPSPTEFYLLDVRKKEGWDEYIPGEGMIITKIKYNYNNWHSNKVNNNYRAMGVDILEAKSNTTWGGDATDAYPAGATQWTDYADHEITNIKRNASGSVSFSYRGAEVPTGIEEISDQLSTTGSQKVLRNGQVVILRNGKEYDLLGRLIKE